MVRVDRKRFSSGTSPATLTSKISMLAEDHLRQGNVTEALAELKKTVQQNPAEPKYRVFLFQLLSVVGKWDSALTQLEVAGDLDPGNLAMVQAYREAIRCQVLRDAVFAGKKSPLIFGQPQQWIALLIQSLQHTSRGEHAQAASLRNEAFQTAPATAGSLEAAGEQQVRFDWIADADSRLGPILEVYLNGQYYWVPMHRIAEIVIEAPEDLRDFVWTPAHFTWSNGGQAVGMIPTRYLGAEGDPDSAIQLARKTEWDTVAGADQDDEAFFGRGQRLIATDEGDFGLLDLRKVTLECDDQSGEATDPPEGDHGN